MRLDFGSRWMKSSVWAARAERLFGYKVNWPEFRVLDLSAIVPSMTLSGKLKLLGGVSDSTSTLRKHAIDLVSKSRQSATRLASRVSDAVERLKKELDERIKGFGAKLAKSFADYTFAAKAPGTTKN